MPEAEVAGGEKRLSLLFTPSFRGGGAYVDVKMYTSRTRNSE